jgi:hypothetical protein
MSRPTESLTLDEIIQAEKELLFMKIEMRNDVAFQAIARRIEFAQQRFRCLHNERFYHPLPTLTNTIQGLFSIEGVIDVKSNGTYIIAIYPYEYRFQILRDELIYDVKKFLSDYLPISLSWALRETFDKHGDSVILITLQTNL